MIRIKFCFIVFLLTATVLSAADFPEIAGWEKDTEISVYQSDNLWEIIDGAAELFLSYGFRELKAFDIKKDSLVMTVHVYDMQTPLNAFGVYRTERPSDTQGLSIGGEAVVLPPYQALLLKGCYYIKIETYEGEISEILGKSLVNAIAAVLPGENGLPKEIALLPEKGMIPNSEGYLRENFLGLEYLNHCLSAEYQLGEEKVLGFIEIAMAPESTDDLWKALSAVWTAQDFHGQSILISEIPYQGFAGVMRKTDGLAGVTHMESLDALLTAMEAIVF